MSNKNNILKDIFSYSASTYISQAIGLASSIWVARQLGPENYGIYNAVTLVLGYAAYTEFGILSAMGRDLPIYIGQNDSQKALAIEGSARYATIYGSICASIIIFLFSFLPSLSSKMSQGFQFMSFVVILQQIYTYHRTVLRCNNNFKELSQQQILLSIFTAGLAILLVLLGGFKGRLFAAFLTQALILLYAIYRNPWKSVPKFNLSYAIEVMKIGLPILASGFIISLLTSIDRLMVITFMDATQLGYFGLSIMLMSLVSLIPAMANQVLFPRINYHFGKTGKNIQELRSYVMKPPLILSALLPIVIGPIYLVLPFIVKNFLPAYSPGIGAARIVVLGIFFYGILGLTDYFLVTTNKLKQYAVFGTIALLLNICLDFLLIKMRFGIEGIAFGGTLITYFLYSSIVIGYALSHYTKLPKDWIVFFSKLWLPFLYMLILLCSVEHFIDYAASSLFYIKSLYSASLKVMLYLLACIPFKFIIARELKLDLSFSSIANFVKK